MPEKDPTVTLPLSLFKRVHSLAFDDFHESGWSADVWAIKKGRLVALIDDDLLKEQLDLINSLEALVP